MENSGDNLNYLKDRLYKQFQKDPQERINYLNQYKFNLTPHANFDPNMTSMLVPKIIAKKQFNQQTQNQTLLNQISIIDGKIKMQPLTSLTPQYAKFARDDQSTLILNQTSFMQQLDSSLEKPSILKNLNESRIDKFQQHIKIQDEINQQQFQINQQNPSQKTLEQNKLHIKRKYTSGNKQQLQRKAKRFPSSRNQTTEEDEEEEVFLTPMDFIHLIKTDPEMADEFCYLNKRAHSYDWKIVEFQKRDKEEYMTISARGITHFVDKEAIFMTIEEWEREVKMFHKLRSIEFFKNYKKWKNFSLWKKLMRRCIMNNCSQILRKELFLLDKHLRDPLWKLRHLCLNLQKQEFFYSGYTEPNKIEDFRASQEHYREKWMEKTVIPMENSIREIVTKSCSTSLVAFKEENRIPNKDVEGNQEEEPAPLLVGDETNKEMPYTQEATIRTHFKRLHKFIKLIDYWVVGAKITLINFSSDILMHNIYDLNQAAITKKNFRFTSWIQLFVDEKNQQIVYNPSKEIAKKTIEDIVLKGSQRIINRHKPLIYLSELQQYTKIEETDDENKEDTLNIQTLIKSDDNYLQTCFQLRKEIDNAFEIVNKYSQFLLPFLQNYYENLKMNVDEFENKDIEEFKTIIRKYQQQDWDFKEQIEQSAELGLFLFDNAELKNKIKHCAYTCLQKLFTFLPELMQRKADSFLSILSDRNAKTNWNTNEAQPNFIESFVQFSEDVSEIQRELDNFSSMNSELTGFAIMFEEFGLKQPEKVKQRLSEVSNSLNVLRKRIDVANASYDQNLNKCKRKFETTIPQMNEAVKELQEKLENSQVNNPDADINTTFAFVDDISKQFTEIYEKSKRINSQQNILILEVTNFEKIQVFREEFMYLEKLWKGRKAFSDNYTQWKSTQFQKLDIQRVQELSEQLIKTSVLCSKELEFNEAAQLFKREMQDFKIVLKTIVPLRDPAVGEQEWVKIKELLKILPDYEILKEEPFSKELDSPEYTLQYIIDLKLMQLQAELNDIAVTAAKEAELLKMVISIEQFWIDASLVIMPQLQNSKDSIYVLGKVENEENISKIDDTLLTLNNILGSRYSERIRDRVEKQMKKFRYLQQFLDEWFLHQRNWLYLEPILTSQASHMGLVKESQKFLQIDAQWKKFMMQAFSNPRAEHFANECEREPEQQNFVKLQNNNKAFDWIQQSLTQYLERKRDQFYRFFFLSNDELLEILSTSKTIQSIQPHLRKCFENVNSLQFDNDIITHMVSAEGEVIQLKVQSVGQEVEDWFKGIEQQMTTALKQNLKNCIRIYKEDSTVRKEWVIDQQFASQIIVVVDSIFWTQITEEEFLTPENEANMHDWYQINLNQLQELTGLIRGNLNKLQRATIVNLITQDVHYRDIVEELLIDDISHFSDFKWQQQLRFYYDDENNCIAKQVNAKLYYNYEYIGVRPRLVITPLTDRCWITITGALHIKLGANPQGPAGTGKTESSKDLAKCLARYCIVFNCSEQINVTMIEKFFTGLAWTGSWTCLDEFNRIDIEVLSVIAQLVLTIREAMLENKSNFFFQANPSRQISLNQQLGIIITMNPGYAGRTELPDNLKVLFRPVSMMVPDYSLIAEIMLFAEGFSEAKELSEKMTKLYKLASEQLSQQDHYDFGMRAVKSVLMMAGNIKRREPDKQEDLILIKAMVDSNIPKFINDDIPLFEAILTDLFPGTKIPGNDSPELEKAVQHQIALEELLPTEQFIEKVIQLHEILRIRFGVMIVGPAMTAKSAIIRILHASYNELHQADPKHYSGSETTILNPKSITLDELYGKFDPDSQQWTDGLIGCILRQFVNSNPLENLIKYAHFDGPVDPIWIENMNTVLDDSMMLCLSNGERIKLRSDMKMLFEIADLSTASPATVSRCGMIYAGREVVRSQEIFKERFQRIIKQFETEFQENEQDGDEDGDTMTMSNVKQVLGQLQKLVEAYFDKAALLVLKQIGQVIENEENQLCGTICNQLEVMLLDEDLRKRIMEGEITKRGMERLFLMFFAWGMAGQVKNREKFETWMGSEFGAEMPKGSIFNYFLEWKKGDGEFVEWQTMLDEFVFDPAASFFSLVVPTKDMYCYQWFLERAMLLLKPVFLTGVTGVGKTIITMNLMKRSKDEGKITSLDVTFSAETSSQSTQYQIESKLEPLRRKHRNIMRPPRGKKMVIFVDDINMPSLEAYGAQPPIELLRQLLDYKGVFDRKTLVWKDIENTVLMIAGGVPGGGRNEMSQRFTRHFMIMCLPKTSEFCLNEIFGQIFIGFLKSSNFRVEVMQLGENGTMVSATLQLYSLLQEILLPTPSKSHYTFNLRDVAKVFQGVLQAKPTVYQNAEQMVRLWTHECMRVFHDRLINEEDRNQFISLIVKQLFLSFHLDWRKEEVFENKQQPLIYCDFLKKGMDSASRVYEPVQDSNKLAKVISAYMVEETKLNLVLFKDAMEHLSRIARILRQERGNILLVGVGGSGKKSLTTLGTVLAGYEIMTIEINRHYKRKNFWDDIFKMMCLGGIENKEIVFLLNDNQIISENFLEDVNNLINNGEIPNLIQKEELELINQGLEEEIRLNKIEDWYSYFISKVRRNVHLVLAMSPVGSDLRRRMRMFPSLVNCCTIDWLNPWPRDALFTVAEMFLESIVAEELQEMQKGAIKEKNVEFAEDENQMPLGRKLATLCVFVDQSVQKHAEEYYKKLRRRVYTTPKSYIQLIESYKDIMFKCKEEISNNRNKLAKGLYKLNEANSTIAGLQEKLIELQPILKQKTLEQDELIKKLEVDKYEANKVKNVVEEEEQIVLEKKDKIQEMKDEADKILNEAKPVLEGAVKALDTLNRGDIAEIKNNNNPHALVKFTLECVGVLLEEKLDWDNIKKLLADPNFLSRLQKLNVYKISRQTQTKIKAKIVSNKNFEPNEIKQISVAAKSLCEWVRAVADFTDVWTEIEVKEKVVTEKNKELDDANKILGKKQKQLAEVTAKVTHLENLYNTNKMEKEKLDAEITKTEQRLERASQLTEGLSDEQIRWKQTVEYLGGQMKLVLGNAFIAGASIAYYGPFTGAFREVMVEEWLSKCREVNLPCSEDYSLRSVLGDEIQIKDWETKGLPSDSISVNNAILINHCSSFPLMIDPQLQAYKWLKNMEAKNNLVCTKQSVENLVKIVEMSLRMASPLMIEDIQETLDPVLEPLLLKQYRVQGQRKMVKIGDSGEIEVDPSFKLFFVSKLSNPHFLPEIFIRVTVINFTVTQEGLEEQLLTEVVKLEMPDVELTRQQLVIEIAMNQANLKHNEDRILNLLNNSKGLILDDVELIQSLKDSKISSTIVKEKLKEAEEKSKVIGEARLQFLPVAKRGTTLYFVVAELNLIDPMYQFSLNYFQKLFNQVIENTPAIKDPVEKIETHQKNITQTIYQNVCRGLFNNHKRIFSFLLASSIELKTGIISMDEWSIFVKGLMFQQENLLEFPQNARFSQKQWQTLNYLQADEGYEKVIVSISKHLKDWEEWIFSDEPHVTPLPEKFEKSLNHFKKLLLVKIFREEKVVYGVTEYVGKVLGRQFTSMFVSTMEEIYNELDFQTPLIFILSPGADPLSNLMRFGKEKGISQDKFSIISLGQGQGPNAKAAIDNGLKTGSWVVLQNCHLGKSFMPELEKKIDSITEFMEGLNRQFRLFLTSMPCDYFPVSILQNSMKLTNEPPKGIKSNVLKTFNELSTDKLNSCSKSVSWKKLIFSLSFFHAVIQERRKFGPLGWNILYEFNDSDLETSLTIVKLLLEATDSIPWEAIRYVIGEINYGGRVTDEWDRRCLAEILKQFCNDNILIDEWQLTASNRYLSPAVSENIEFYKSFILEFPDTESPDVFGMHENANITFQMQESKQTLDTILSIQPKESVGGGNAKTPDQIVANLCKMLEDKMPRSLKKPSRDLQKMKSTVTSSPTMQLSTTQTKTAPALYLDQLLICLMQEAERFNKLLNVMKDSLANIKKAIKGETIMSAELDAMYSNLLSNQVEIGQLEYYCFQVPENWHKKAYPSLKPLASWYEDLIQRIDFFQNWIDSGYLKAYWLSAFFFPQGFLTALLQNYARKYVVPIDQLSFSFKFEKYYDVESIQNNLQDGCYVYGLYIEGCRFETNYLQLSLPNVMITNSPIIQFIPTANYSPNPNDYQMPVYKTLARAGTLSTTGHSTNFIIAIDCPTKRKPEFWILNGCAMTCQLNQ